MSTYLKNYETKTNDGKMVFDWDLAVDIITSNNIKNAKAGLKGDWDLTSGFILKDGKPVFEFTYLSSPFNIPILRDIDSGKDYPCFINEYRTKYTFESTWTKKLIKKLGV